MLGNVKEITCSKYVEYYDTNETRCDPRAKFHALRGGGFSSTEIVARAANRFRVSSSDKGDWNPTLSMGFRLAMKAP